MEIINTELALADLQTIEKVLPRIEKEARTNKERQVVLDAIKAAEKVLNEGKPLSGSGVDLEALAELHLMTAKPFLYVFNVDAAEMNDAELRAKLSALVAPAEAIFLDAKTEAELAELSDEDALEPS